MIIQSAQQIQQGERRQRAIEGSPAGCTAAHGDDARPLQFVYNLIGKGPGDLFIFRKDRDAFSRCRRCREAVGWHGLFLL